MATATNLFANAKTIKKAAKGASKKDEVLIEGVEADAAIDHVIKWLKALHTTIRGAVTELATDKFLDDGILISKKPESFNAVEGKGNANIQLKKRSTASGLTEIEELTCRTHNVPLGKAGGEYIFNPEHNEWLMNNAAKISKLLTSIPGCPKDLLMQNPEKVVTTDASLDYVFANFKADRSALRTLLPMVGTIAVKAKFDTADTEDDATNERAFDVIKALLNAGEE